MKYRDPVSRGDVVAFRVATDIPLVNSDDNVVSFDERMRPLTLFSFTRFAELLVITDTISTPSATRIVTSVRTGPRRTSLVIVPTIHSGKS